MAAKWKADDKPQSNTTDNNTKTDRNQSAPVISDDVRPEGLTMVAAHNDGAAALEEADHKMIDILSLLYLEGGSTEDLIQRIREVTKGLNDRDSAVVLQKLRRYSQVIRAAI